MTELPSRRLLLVHAHPDDESINNGATMAAYAADGALVTLVTCTLGEEGEVIGSEAAHLVSAREDRLGPYRIGELRSAMGELGVHDHRFLGGAGRYRDSGMMGAPQNRHPDAFWGADLDSAAAHLVEVIREVRPQVLVTYDPEGGYGHPDHIQAHRVAMRAVDLAAEGVFRRDLGDPHTVAKVYWNRVPRGILEKAFAPLDAVLPTLSFPEAAEPSEVSGVAEDSLVSTVVETDSRARAAKAAAMTAHATQVRVEGDWFALSNDRAQPLLATEAYPLVHGRRSEAVIGVGGSGTAGLPEGLERDLFAGLGLEERL